MSLATNLLAMPKASARRAWLSAIVLAVLQTAVIGYVVASRAAILATGAEVLLKAAPVDPRDLLRGDYVTLGYDISSVPMSTLRGALPAVDSEQTLFVRLTRQADGYWGVDESSFQPLPLKPESVVIKSQPFDYRPALGATSVRVAYGIERYYVPEGEGKSIEEAPREGRLGIAARISSSGTAQIRRLLVDGLPVYEEPLY